MMTPNMLNRATHAFRRGYNDAYNGQDVGRDVNPYAAGTFHAVDWAEGFKAACDEMRFSEPAKYGPIKIKVIAWLDKSQAVAYIEHIKCNDAHDERKNKCRLIRAYFSPLPSRCRW